MKPEIQYALRRWNNQPTRRRNSFSGTPYVPPALTSMPLRMPARRSHRRRGVRPFALKGVCRNACRNLRAPSRQHQRNQFVPVSGKLLPSTRSASANQNPPRQTLIELAASVGDRGMSSLNHEGLHVTTGCC